MSAFDLRAWARRPGWTVVEATALLHGLSPALYQRNRENFSLPGERVGIEDDLALAVALGTFTRYHPATRTIPPADVIAWAGGHGITVPHELAAAVASATGRASYDALLAEVEQLKARLATVETEDDAKPVGSRAKKSFLLTIGFLAEYVADQNAAAYRHADKSVNDSAIATMLLQRAQGVPDGMSHDRLKKRIAEAVQLASKHIKHGL